jgi:hypothetical protein
MAIPLPGSFGIGRHPLFISLEELIPLGILRKRIIKTTAFFQEHGGFWEGHTWKMGKLHQRFSFSISLRPTNKKKFPKFLREEPRLVG